MFIHQRDEPERLKEQDSYLSTDLPSSLSDCLWSPLLLLTLTGFTPPPPKFDCGCRRSLHSNTRMARANGVCVCVRGETTICGNHGDRSYCIIPQHKSTWRKGAPITLNMRCFPAKTRSLIHDEPHPNHRNNGWKCFFVVAFNFVHVTEFCLRCIYFLLDNFRTTLILFSSLSFLYFIVFYSLFFFLQGCCDEMLHNLPELDSLVHNFLWRLVPVFKLQEWWLCKIYIYVVYTLYLQIFTMAFSYCEFSLF